MCTFQYTIEMYRAPHEADDFGTDALQSGALSNHRFGASVDKTLPPVLGERWGKSQTMPYLASVFDSDPLQVLCHFPDLLSGRALVFRCKGPQFKSLEVKDGCINF